MQLLERTRNHQLYAVAKVAVIFERFVDCVFERVSQLNAQILERSVTHAERVAHIDSGIFGVAVDVVEAVATEVINHTAGPQHTTILWQVETLTALDVDTLRCERASQSCDILSTRKCLLAVVFKTSAPTVRCYLFGVARPSIFGIFLCREVR